MISSVFRSGLPVVLAFGLALGTAFAAPVYTIQNLGVLRDFALSTGIALNDAGQVTGWSQDIGFPPLRAFRYTDGMGMQGLGVLPGTFNSLGNGINEAGQVVGMSAVSDRARAFRYTDGVGMEDLGALPGHSASVARSINNAGQVTGASSVGPFFGPGSHAFRYTDGVGMEDLGANTANAINNSGQVAGVSMGRASRYTDGIGWEDLGVLPGTEDSLANAINNSGQVAGASGDLSFDTGPAAHAFRFTDGVGMEDLGRVPDRYSEAFGINDNGDVVGYTYSLEQPSPRILLDITDPSAFLYTDALGMVDLNTLLRPDSGWDLRYAYDINNRGQITGFGSFTDPQVGRTQFRAYLLTPVPEPGSAAMLLIGLLALAGLARHR
jgi:probable HAF family extracellular repeat protein